jgi:ABC-type amino acid transport substrate-binding protein
LTKERCGQVLFTDPVTFDGGAIAVAEGAAAPASIGEVAAGTERVGVLQGSYLVKLATDLGIAESRLSQFPSNPALIDGLQAGRVSVVISTNAALRQLREQRGGYDIVYPLTEDPPVGSAPAFSTADKDLHAAFQAELRQMYSATIWERSARRSG